MSSTSEPRYMEFVWLPTFERTAAGLLDVEDQRRLELRMLNDPECGSVMPRTGGFRKLRWGTGGSGRRGGARIIYFYLRHRARIYLVLAYAKGAKEDLTEAERAELKELAGIIKRERD